MADDDLEAIKPARSETIELRGESIAVEPLRIGQLPAFLRAVRPLLPRFVAIADAGDEQDQQLLLDLIVEGGESLIEAMAVALRKPASFVAELALDETVRAVEKIIEVNLDFFYRRLLPELASVRASLKNHRGQTSSSGSSAPATGAPRS